MNYGSTLQLREIVERLKILEDSHKREVTWRLELNQHIATLAHDIKSIKERLDIVEDTTHDLIKIGQGRGVYDE